MTAEDCALPSANILFSTVHPTMALLHEDLDGTGPDSRDTPRGHTGRMQSKIHPKYKTKYRVANWAAYNQSLEQRGDVTCWLAPEAIAAWTPRRSGMRGGQRRCSDLAIQTALTLRLVYHLPLRQAEGFLHSLFAMMHLDLSAPDYTTVSRRGQQLRHRLRPVPTGGRIHLVLDSTGLSIVGEGEWAAAQYGGRGRRGWKKLHIGVDRSGVILAHTLTKATVDDATTALDLITAIDGNLVSVTADAAYDTVAVYETAAARGGDGRGATGQDGECSSPRPAITRPGSNHHIRKEARTPAMEEDRGLSPASESGERLLPVQVDHWRGSSCAQSNGAAERSGPRL